MKFPTIVYKKDGPYSAGGSKTYDFREANNQDELGDLLGDGWNLTLPECFEEVKKPVVKSIEVEFPEDAKIPEDNDKPTRKELEQQARELGLKFDGRTSDESLLNRINEALSAE